MEATEVLWLRAAAALYSAGLFHTAYTILRKRTDIFKPVLGIFCLATVLHMVSLVETAVRLRHFPANNFAETVSLCAFVISATFLLIYWRYRFQSLSVFLFPLIFVMTLAGAMQGEGVSWSTPVLRGAWLTLHVVLVLLGYAAMLVMAVASFFYLLQERQLKAKRPESYFERLPPLATLDDLISRAMGVGFVLITLGVITGSTWAYIEFGTRWLADPKIAISFITWLFYLLMVFLRWSAGWRGRKAAILALTVLFCSAATWAAHVGLRSKYLQ
ncbi:MAG TPA: cytochrome c biogenesis protein CcsA [Bryobacteraceae bacterium]|nr:cytochrome c biogenesis protein CcsA [Bryobacteraceae bacterium]